MSCLLQEQISCKETGADSLEPQMVEISAIQALISFRLAVLCWYRMYNYSLGINNMALEREKKKIKGKLVDKMTMIHRSSCEH